VTTPAPSRRLGHTIHRLGAVASTQGEAARLAAAGASEGTVVTATHQSAGRGRRGREWLDAPRESLLMSIVLRPPIPPGLAPQLSLVAVVAVVDALGRTGVTATIRWPNDVMVGTRKICGMLPEAVTTREGTLENVILGIGLNVNQRDFPASIQTLATSVRIETGREHAVEELLQAVLAGLEGWYRRFVEGGLDVLLPAWLGRAQGIGRRARAADGREGIAVGLAADGALLLRTDSGETVRVVAGEIATEVEHAAGH
jgi:BirA family transcriptional regulator, biotin operon repressor / biotin---[acetyl-CoA-carboxylase] ligase